MTLQEFYRLMSESAITRRRIVAAILDGREAEAGDVAGLDELRESLNGLPGSPQTARLVLGSGEIICNLDYEVRELDKDLIFLREGRDALVRHLAGLHENHVEQSDACEAWLRESPPDLFITDRDGTINNYCGRYRSSVQSVYNGVFVARFVGGISGRGVILTSAPLRDGGLLDVNVMPSNLFVFAGSKGREYLDDQGMDGRFEMSPQQELLMNRLNAELEALVSKPELHEFALIGSGLQKKFGQATVARQDTGGSIAPEKSREFLEIVEKLVHEVDAQGDGLRIEDTGLDIEILLTASAPVGSPRPFDKGDGLKFLDERLYLGAPGRRPLVCGDSEADLSMLKASAGKWPLTRAIFITGDEELRRQARSLCVDALFLDSPDILVTALERVSLDL